jgi:HTH-type transcriptional regulator/antitoxin HigA
MNATAGHPFRPNYVSPPGDTLRDYLAALNLSQAELAARAGLSTKHVNQIIQGLAPITLETAIVLERVTGMSASFWNRREADYREALLRAKRRTLTNEDEAWLASLPIKELQKRNKLPAAKDRGQLLDAVLSFFGVADREAYERIWSGPVVSFRRSAAFSSRPGAVISWLRLAQIAAQPAKVEPYSASLFRRVLHDIRALTAQGDPNSIVEMCAAAGVVVVFVPEVKGCRISGAAWWASPTRAVIALSDRYKKDDFFWFTFFHEAAHLLLHSKKETFVDDGSDNDMLEDEANRFAADFLIPPDRAKRLPIFTTDAEVEDFAEDIGIAPGIVVGRMQHDEIWDFSQGHKLKRSLRIVGGDTGG